MDQVWLAFEATLAGDRPTRDGAEAFIGNFCNSGAATTGDFALLLLEFCVAPPLLQPPTGALGLGRDDDVRVAAGIRLKNITSEAAWCGKKKTPPAFTPPAKASFKSALISALCDTVISDRVRRILLVVLAEVHSYEWRSGQWPELLPLVESALRGSLNTVAMVLHELKASQSNELGDWADGQIAPESDAIAEQAVPQVMVLACACRLLSLCAKTFRSQLDCTFEEHDAFTAFMTPLIGNVLGTLTANDALWWTVTIRRRLGLLGTSATSHDSGHARLLAGLDECTYLCLKASHNAIVTRVPEPFADGPTFAALQQAASGVWWACNVSFYDLRSGVLTSSSEPLDDNDVQDSASQRSSRFFWKLYKRVALVSHEWLAWMIKDKMLEKRLTGVRNAFLAKGGPAFELLDCALWTVWLHHNESFQPNPLIDDPATLGRMPPLPLPHDGQPPRQMPVTSKAHINAMLVIVDAASQQGLYGRLHQIAAPLLLEVVFARLGMSDREREQWSANPVEFVRQLSDPDGDDFNPKLRAAELLTTLCAPAKAFQDASLIAGFAKRIEEVLSTAPQVVANAQNFDEGSDAWHAALQLDACLFAMSQLRTKISSGWPIAHVLNTYVVPLLSSSVGFLRARAMHVIASFLKMVEWQPNDYVTVLRQALPLLSDPELPVRMRMAMSCAAFVLHPLAYDFVQPQVGRVVTQLLEAMKEMDDESVVCSLRKIIKHYAATVTEWALDLTQALVAHFSGLYQIVADTAANENADDAQEDAAVDAASASEELLAAVGSLIKAIPKRTPNGEDTAPLFTAMQELLAPLLAHVVGEGRSNYMDVVLRLITRLVQRSNAVMPGMWEVFKMFHRIMVDLGMTDHFRQLISPIDNFISADAVTFVSASSSASYDDGPQASPAAMLLSICQKVVSDDDLHRRDERIEAVTPTEIVFLNARAANVDPTVAAAFADRFCAPFAGLAGSYFGWLQSRGKQPSSSEWVLLGDCILSSLLYAASFNTAVLPTSHAPAHLDFILGRYSELYGELNLRVFDRKLFVLAVVQLVTAAAQDPTMMPYLSALRMETHLQTAIALLMQNAALDAAATVSCVEKAAKYAARGGAHVDADEDNSDLDDFSDGDDDDSDDSEFDDDDLSGVANDDFEGEDGDDGDDGEDGEEGEGGYDEDDKQNRQWDKLRHSIAQQRRYIRAEAGLEDDPEILDEVDAGVDHLNNVDFTSPIDGEDEYAAFGGLLGGLSSSTDIAAPLRDLAAAAIGAFSHVQNNLPAELRAPGMQFVRGHGTTGKRGGGKQQSMPLPLVYSADATAGEAFGGDPAPHTAVVSLAEMLHAASQQRAFLREHGVRVKR
jgi:hypothetical protein